ncbi:uncharacterized protein LOC105189252 [Harpegnathos saltator]|uniref:uncharacterized protein LOC105189252 n=1 Tax=Harpegnathos saltator TaxID=610380 RepID=UPI000DBEE8B7|nr:uncharacterized protein LOC105189252 [Harpegnathos saltator]
MAAERKEHDYASMQMARFLMKTVGFWTSDKKGEERLLKGILGYTLFAIVLALWIESTEFYFSIGDFYAVTYTACSSMPVVIVLMKILFFLTYREEMLTMLRYTQERFWYAQYDDYGRKLMDDINRKGMIIMCTFTFFVQVTVVTYMLTPIIENRGRNESERILPFNWYVGIDTHVSPNFEIIFVFEVMHCVLRSVVFSSRCALFTRIIALVHAGICFCCFDNLLGLLGMHTAGQFKLLQHRLETILERIGQAGDLGSLDEKTKRAVHEEIRGCVLQHQELIWYSEKMEGLFMYTTLCQLLVSSVMICVAGFQVFLSRGTLMRRMIFIAHTNGSVGQLFVVTFTAHHLLEESRAVGDSAYSANWEVLSHQDNRSIRNAVLMLMVRSTHACSISAGGFFPVSLETFMAVRSALKDPQTRDSCLNDSDFVPPQVMSTAASYFALLRNFIVDEAVTGRREPGSARAGQEENHEVHDDGEQGVPVGEYHATLHENGRPLARRDPAGTAVPARRVRLRRLGDSLRHSRGGRRSVSLHGRLLRRHVQPVRDVAVGDDTGEAGQLHALPRQRDEAHSFRRKAFLGGHLRREPRATNETQKALPFKLWLEFPYHSPYYEVTYTIQSLSTIHSGICTFCFDNFVSTFNIHAAAQLKILAHKVEIVAESCVEGATSDKSSQSEAEIVALTFERLQDCVRQHYTLIQYLHNMQHVFAIILLGQLLLSSVVICFGGFQFLATDVAIRKCIFAFHFVGGLIQLLIYTWTCNDIIVQSAAISDAAYNSKWYLLPGSGPGMALRKGLIMIMIRARRPCTLTAGHFAVMSLDTFTGILSTAMSYFTLLRQMSEEGI